jgi:glc operon protein GlcG
MAPVISPQTIGSEGARQALAAAVDRAQALEIAVCVAVVDRSATLLAYVHMDGAPLASARLAQDKAWTAAAFRQATHEVWDDIGAVPALAHGLPKFDRVVVFGGGVPITADGETLGAVGISGGTPEQDRLVAEAGAGAIAAAAG